MFIQILQKKFLVHFFFTIHNFTVVNVMHQREAYMLYFSIFVVCFYL